MLFSNNLGKQLLVEEIEWSGIRSEHNELLTCLTLNIDNHKRKKNCTKNVVWNEFSKLITF